MKPIPFIVAALLCWSAAFSQNVTTYDIWKGTNTSNPRYLTEYNGNLYFYADDSTHGSELWCIDTLTGAHLVADIHPGKAGNLPFVANYNLLELHLDKCLLDNGSKALFFFADDGIHGTELFQYDGISPPKLAKDIIPGSTGITPIDNIATVNKKVYFANYASAGVENLWEYEPKTGNAQIVAKMQPYTPIRELTQFNNKLAFISDNPAKDCYCLYDPILDTVTVMLHDIQLEADFKVLNNRLYFQVNYSSWGNPNSPFFFSSDGVTTIKIDSFCAAAMEYTPYTFYNNKIYYSGCNNLISTLKEYDPATNKVKFVGNINSGDNCFPNSFVTYNGILYFSAYDATKGYSLWEYDDINPPKVALNLYVNPNQNTINIPSLYGLHALSNGIYFVGTTVADGKEMFKYSPWQASVENLSFDGKVILYPNPAQDVCVLQVELKRQQTLSVQVNDINGKEVYHSENFNAIQGSSSIKIPVQNLSAGTYSCYLLNDKCEMQYCTKLIKN